MDVPVKLFSSAYGKGKSEKTRFIIDSTGESSTKSISFTRSAAYTSASSTDPTLSIPLVAVPWGIMYNFCDISQKSPCSAQISAFELTLTVELIVALVTGSISVWNDTRLLDAQPTLAERNILDSVGAQPIKFISYLTDAIELAHFRDMLAAQGFPDVDLETSAFVLAKDNVEARSLVTRTTYSFTFGWLLSANLRETVKAARFSPSLRIGSTTTWQANCVDEIGSLLVQPSSACWPLMNKVTISSTSVFDESSCQTGEAEEITYFLASMVTNSNNNLLQSVGIPLVNAMSYEMVEQIMCFGRSILAPKLDLQQIPRAVIHAVRAIAGIVMIGLLWFAFWVVRSRAVLPHYFYVLQSVLGCTLQIASVIPLTFEDNGETSAEQLDMACMAAPWLFCVGFALAFGPLMARIWKFHIILHNNTARIFKGQTGFEIKFIALLLVQIIIILTVWNVLDPMVWKRVPVEILANGFVTISVGLCASNNVVPFIVPLVVVLFTAISSTLIIAWINRNHAGQYRQVRQMVILSIAYGEALIMAIPVILLANNNSFASFGIKVFFIVFTSFFIMSTVSVPVFAKVLGWWSSSHGADGSRDIVDNSKTSSKNELPVDHRLSKQRIVASDQLVGFADKGSVTSLASAIAADGHDARVSEFA